MEIGERATTNSKWMSGGALTIPFFRLMDNYLLHVYKIVIFVKVIDISGTVKILYHWDQKYSTKL